MDSNTKNKYSQKREEIEKFVSSRINYLKHSKAALAKLRRGIGKPLGELPQLMGYILPEKNFFNSEQIENRLNMALYTTFTLYALNQQGKFNEVEANDECTDSSKNTNGNSLIKRNNLGRATRLLIIRNPENEEALTRRFNKVLTANSMEELATHARGIINLLRRDNIPLYYPRFAYDLYLFQNEDRRRSVILDWGRGFYQYSKIEKEVEKND